MLVALTITCAVGCGLLVLAEWRHLAGVRIASKLLASAAFVAIGFEAFHIAHDGARVHFGQLIFIGLVLGAIGDVALLGRSNAAFLAGLVAFLGGHIGYVVAATFVLAPGDWLAAAGVYTALPAAAGAVALALLWPKLGSMRVPVIAYVVTIISMVVAAIAVARGKALPDPQRCRFVAGAALFFVSDLAVARDKFVARAFVNRLWGLPAYYAGQLLIAWALIGL